MATQLTALDASHGQHMATDERELLMGRPVGSARLRQNSNQNDGVSPIQNLTRA